MSSTIVCTLKPACESWPARTAQLQQVEDRLDVGVEPVIALAGKRAIAVAQLGDRLRGVDVQVGVVGHAVLGRPFAVVVLVVLRRGVALVVRRHDAPAQSDGLAAARIDPGDV